MKNILCNPIDLPYSYQHVKGHKYAFREGADPTVCFYKGIYYLFVSMCGGFYYSTDLFNWKFHKNNALRTCYYAPDARVINGALYFCSSTKMTGSSPILRSENPLEDDFKLVSKPFAFWDPDLFQDDDGKVYLYYGCSNRDPIKGIELDDKMFITKGEPVSLICERMNYSGFEQTKGKNDIKINPIIKMIIGDKPFIEGAYMNKFNGTYYLQYACPGTEYANYGDGVYTSNNPLGPFKVQKHNPFSTKPGGFATGAGHGSTFYDSYGNLWHISTMRISINHNYERRIGMFPALLDSDGILACNTNFGDYPYEFSEGKFDTYNLKPKYMLLSYNKPVQVSSFKEGHEAKYIVDEDIRTSWCNKDTKEATVTLDLGEITNVGAIQVNFSDVEIPIIKKKKSELDGEPTIKRWIDTSDDLVEVFSIYTSKTGSFYELFKDNITTKSSNYFLNLEEMISVRYIRLVIKKMPYNAHPALSGLRVFGIANHPLPNIAMSKGTRVDDFHALIEWKNDETAIGHNIRYGISKDKLYSSILTYGSNSVMLDTLDKDNDYFVCVDSFNGSGIKEGVVFKLERK